MIILNLNIKYLKSVSKRADDVEIQAKKMIDSMRLIILLRVFPFALELADFETIFSPRDRRRNAFMSEREIYPAPESESSQSNLPVCMSIPV